MAQTAEGARKCAAKRLGIPLAEYDAKLAEGLKRCTKCKSWKPAAAFGKDATRHDGLSARCLDCGRVTVRQCTKGRTSPFKGRKHTEAARGAMSAANIGRQGNRLGKKHSAETKARMSEIAKERTPRGETHYAYTHGRSQRDRDGRRSVEYKRWRDAVFARDNYTCRECGDARGGNLQAHHVKPYAGHPELRFAVENGITLCRTCHERLHLKPIPTPADIRRRRKHVG